MTLFIISIVFGLALLVWSADKFIDGASAVAKHYGMSPLLIGMVIIGFGTSAPEMVVSALAAWQGSPGIALGNAYGSNITNIALILGLTSIIFPITVKSQILKKELPILLLITVISVLLIADLELSRADGIILLVVFSLLMLWTISQDIKRNKADHLSLEVAHEMKDEKTPIGKSYFLLIGGLILLIASSRILVYGAVGIASALGVSDIIVGLTVVAIGTSLPELASSVIAARKGESDIAIGNIIGSNLFNTLAVVGIAGTISPFSFDRDILYRDVGVMSVLTIALFLFSYGFRKKGVLTSVEGFLFVASYTAYVVYLISNTIV